MTTKPLGRVVCAYRETKSGKVPYHFYRSLDRKVRRTLAGTDPSSHEYQRSLAQAEEEFARRQTSPSSLDGERRSWLRSATLIDKNQDVPRHMLGEGAEHLVLGLLLTMGLEAHKASYRNAEGHDIVVVDRRTRRSARIQVKCRRGSMQFKIDPTTCDFVVTVGLRSGMPDVHCLPARLFAKVFDVDRMPNLARYYMAFDQIRASLAAGRGTTPAQPRAAANPLS